MNCELNYIMSWWQALILGIIQGLTEFIPVSSSGHLILTREIVGVGNTYDFMLFDLILHIATLAAIGIVMRKDIAALFRKPFKVALFIIIATIPVVIVGFLLGDIIRVYLFSATYLWIFFLITATILITSEMVEKKLSPKGLAKATINDIKEYWKNKNVWMPLDYKPSEAEMYELEEVPQVDVKNKKEGTESTQGEATPVTAAAKTKKPEYLPDLKLKHALAMGGMQMLAALPGISRSGSTIFGGVVTNGKRKTIAKFSFLMSIPVILGATVLDVLQGIISEEPSFTAANISWYGYVLGAIFSFIAGIFAIKVMLKLISKADFKWFSLYMFTLSIITFFVFFLPYVRG